MHLSPAVLLGCSAVSGLQSQPTRPPLPPEENETSPVGVLSPESREEQGGDRGLGRKSDRQAAQLRVTERGLVLHRGWCTLNTPGFLAKETVTVTNCS